jgi:subtilisin family serine protease
MTKQIRIPGSKVRLKVRLTIGLLVGLWMTALPLLALPVELPPALRTQAPDAAPPAPGAKHSKLAPVLVRAAALHATQGRAWKAGAGSPELLVEGDRILVEIRLRKSEGERLVSAFSAKGLAVRNRVVPRLLEAWVPVGQLQALAADQAVGFIRPARRVIPLTGSVDTQEVLASSANLWHAAGITGAGVVLGNIDGGYLGFAARQATGDWPTGAQLTTVNVNGGAFGTNTNHGTSTVEINFDMAPGAHFVTYETTTLGDWYNALVQTPADGVQVVSVSLGAPLDGVGDGSECPNIFPAPCGTIAEAAGIARAQGVLVVNAAGNERNSHWGGLYNPLPANPATHNWGTGNVLQSSACLPTSFPIQATLHWDSWTTVNHDYDLRLYRLAAGPAWQLVASSLFPQNGGAGQTPQEFVQFTASGTSPGCPANFSNYGFLVQRVSAATNKNLQLFTGLPLFNFVPARSLGFPGDSPNVFTVAAVDVTTTAQEVYSSEGPVLGSGGTLGASLTLKPDAASVANVSTAAAGPGAFNGTSSATPHVAGIAALLLQHNPGLTVEQLHQQLQLVAAAHDLGAAGFDTKHGYGLVRFGVGPAFFDTDGDGVVDDGSGSGLAGDTHCTGGATASCDDNCILTPNTNQADGESDGRGDVCDNCQKAKNGPSAPDAGGFVQRDTNLDGYGNMCDPDYNDDGKVNDDDITIFDAALLSPTYTPDVDNDGNGSIGRSDYRILKNLYGNPAGPSGLACAGSIPCPPWP